jgi:hypothetical protein
LKNRILLDNYYLPGELFNTGAEISPRNPFYLLKLLLSHMAPGPLTGLALIGSISGIVRGLGEPMSKLSWAIAFWMLALSASALCQTVPAPNASRQLPLSQADAETVVKAVKQCVDQVHADNSEPGLRGFYMGFDAFYNLGSGRVENNAYRPVDQKPLFIFRKCMNERGVPMD